MWVYFNLKAPILPSLHRCTMAEADFFQQPAEGNDVHSERPSQICRVASGMETAEIPIQLAFGWPDAGVVANDQWRIDSYYRAAVPGFGMNPFDNLVLTVEARDVLKPQCGSVKRKAGQAAGLSVPTEVHADERTHDADAGRLSPQNTSFSAN
jgi:hypothetical protein